MTDFFINCLDKILYWNAYFSIFTVTLALWKVMTGYKNSIIFIVGVVIALILSNFSLKILRLRRLYVVAIITLFWCLSFYLFRL